jgi:hypothetical protein
MILSFSSLFRYDIKSCFQLVVLSIVEQKHVKMDMSYLDNAI